MFRISILDATERFYTALLGPPLHRTQDSVMYLAGDTRLIFTTAADPNAVRYNKEYIGLNHITFGVRTLSELQAIESQLMPS